MKKYNLVLIALVGITFMLLSSCKKEEIDKNPDGGKTETATLYQEEQFTTECGGVERTFTEVTVIDRGEGTGTTTWTNDKTYILDGFVFVNKGQTLTIEPGTVIKGKSGQGENASALIVARGAKIIARGTSTKPIIFTSEADKIYSNVQGICNESSLGKEAKGLWGGLIILGNSSIAKATTESVVEGIPTSETRGLYGGDEEDDNSGVLSYVSIRHGGSNIGAGNEINGLTLAAVGSETEIDHVEVFANQDDGIEFFGGTVNTSYLVSAFCGDDGIDYDEGWRGNNQFWLVYQLSTGDRGGEHDGGNSDCEACKPYSIPLIANATFIGNGSNKALSFRDNAGGKYFNSVFHNYQEGVDIEYLGEADSYRQWQEENLRFEGNILSNVSTHHFVLNNATADDVTEQQALLTRYFKKHNYADSLELNGVVPNSGSIADNAGKVLDVEFIENVPYKGAFKAGVTPWFIGWTKLGTIYQ